MLGASGHGEVGRGGIGFGAVSLMGTVLAVQANYYRVRLDGAVEGRELEPVSELPVSELPVSELPVSELLCLRRSRLKKIGQRVMVGDRVVVEEPDWQGARGAIAAILPRTSELDRPPVANADQVLLVFALAEPELDPWQLSRFLVKAELTGLELVLALSKADLVRDQTVQGWVERLQGWGYEPWVVPLEEDVEALRQRLGRGRVGLVQEFAAQDLANQSLAGQRLTIVAGPSGVGKSSLINRLIPALGLRTGAVSGKLARGRHTTRHVELFELPGGGLLADTPGFNQPDLECVPSQLGLCFPEVRSRLARGRCQFNDCLHREEPGCRVRGDWERYGYYLELLAEVCDRYGAVQDSTDGDAVLKRRARRDGSVVYEPRLAPQKFRRESRRSRRQDMAAMAGRVEELTESEESEL